MFQIDDKERYYEGKMIVFFHQGYSNYILECLNCFYPLWSSFNETATNNGLVNDGLVKEVLTATIRDT